MQADSLTVRTARIELTPEVFDDFDRFFDHFTGFKVADGPKRIGAIIQSLQILTFSPLIGREVKSGKRELVIGQDAYGYVALYRYLPDIDTVFVLAIRIQRESGTSLQRETLDGDLAQRARTGRCNC